MLSIGNKKISICIIGAGYIGLPLAICFSKKKFDVCVYDINNNRINELKKKIDSNNETNKKDLKYLKKIFFTNNRNDIKYSNIYIITAPTPVNKKKQPDLKMLINATKTVAKFLYDNDLVIYESTVYPTLTEKICLPILEKFSNLKNKLDLSKTGFFIGYSPERVNPGDKKHTLEKISKIVSSNCDLAANFMKKFYSIIIKAKVVKARNIKTAEAAKVIENTQRDLNIAFFNELSIIFNKMGIFTHDVINIAKTKWNFIDFKPGLVGGHCIGVDPYYLTHICKKINYVPNVILSGRQINDYIPKYLTKEFLKIIKNKKITCKNILIFGATFKENCSDIRNSKSIELAKILIKLGYNVNFYEPKIKRNNIEGIKNINKIKTNYYSALFFNVFHNEFRERKYYKIHKKLKKKHIIVDVKNFFPKNQIDFSL